MGKKRKSTTDATDGPGVPLLSTGNKMIDPTLASLFDSSAGPVVAPRFTAPKQSATLDQNEEKASNEAGESQDIPMEDVEDGDEELSAISDVESSEMEEDAGQNNVPKERNLKRKRGDREDDVEESYMRRIAEEEARERKKRLNDDPQQRRDFEPVGNDEESESESESEADGSQGENESDEEEDAPPPLHESLMKQTPESSAVEKSARTVFLGNVSTEAIRSKSAKKTLQAHLSSFFPSLSDSGNATPRIESIRFRSTAFSSTVVPKRAAYAKRELMDSTTHSTNAYVVYNTTAAARKALTLNGSVVLDRHLRVDSVAHPAKVDHRRCVFVGNLGFVDEETSEENGKKKSKPPADSEEGLWRTFNAHAVTPNDKTKNKPTPTGSVEYVRVVRDRSTRVGKGFAYVQFHDENAVEAALLLDGKKYPPLLPRKLRVVRAKRNATGGKRDAPDANAGKKMGKHASLAGRAERMFGQAGAAKLREKEKSKAPRSAATGANSVTASGMGTRIVFEGHRASETKTGGAGGFKVKTKSRGVKAHRGKPKTRSVKRAKMWKKGKSEK